MLTKCGEPLWLSPEDRQHIQGRESQISIQGGKGVSWLRGIVTGLEGRALSGCFCAVYQGRHVGRRGSSVEEGPRSPDGSHPLCRGAGCGQGKGCGGLTEEVRLSLLHPPVPHSAPPRGDLSPGGAEGVAPRRGQC